MAGHGAKCYHFLVRRALTLLLATLALCSCLRSLDESENTDAAIKARVMASLQGQPDIDLRYVTVDVHDAVVTLSGIAANGEQSRAMNRIARSTRGVEQTMNNLLIQE